MGETLMERRRVEDEGPSARKPLSFANKGGDPTRRHLIVAEEEGTANSVPAAAVIQRSQALFGFTGRKGCVGGGLSRV